jgi:hypothetical protein
MARKSTAKTVSIPPPIGGLNTRDSQSLMKPEDAIVMENWTPGIGDVSVRTGSTTHQSAVGSGNVDTITEINVGTVRQLLAASNGNVYDASGAPSSLASGFSVNRWQTVQMDAKVGFVNGTDAAQIYDGTTWAAMTLSGGITATSIKNLMVHRSRSYMVEKDSQDFWYSAVDALGGSMTKFPLSRVGGFGGNLICLGSLNIEGGSDTFGSGGIASDLAVFVMSSGDCIVYEGDDPGGNFNLIGVYRIGAPVDERAMIRRGKDLLCLTTEGLVSITAMMIQGTLEPSVTVSDKIRPTLATAVKDYSANTGWQVIHHAASNSIIINVPISTTVFEQYVMNTETGSWSHWTGLAARCWGLYNDALYFGDTGALVIQSTGADDLGAAIVGDMQSAYAAFGKAGQLKRCAAIRPTFRGRDNISVGIAAQFDYQKSEVTPVLVEFGPGTGAWESIETLWEDFETNWDGSGAQAFAEWRAADGVGYVLGSRIQSSTTEALSLEAITYQIEPGQGMI